MEKQMKEEEGRFPAWDTQEKQEPNEPIPEQQPEGIIQAEEPHFLYNGEPQKDIPLNDGTQGNSETPEEPQKKKSILREIWWFFRPAVICCAILLLVTTFLIFYAVVPSGSMEPTIMTDSLILANRRAYDRSSPQRGDIIVFETDQSESKLLVKRVVATEGETVELRNGAVYINGERLEEPYAVGETQPNKAGSVFQVPQGCVLVFGDNREKSADARYWDDPYVPVSNIKGRVFLTFSLNPKNFYFTPIQNGGELANEIWSASSAPTPSQGTESAAS